MSGADRIAQGKARFAETADRLSALLPAKPDIAAVFGSGLRGAADFIPPEFEISPDELPYFPCPRTQGHSGLLRMGEVRGRIVLAFLGRVHSYEGYDFPDTAAPVFTAHALGARSLLLTNAAGGVNPLLAEGDLMSAVDCLATPLARRMGGALAPVGNAENARGRAPEPDAAYAAILREAALAAGVTLREGVYGYCAGPSYETPAEVAFMRRAGIDAVGMSTLPELAAAWLLGMKTAVISCITNKAATIPVAADHDRVTAAAAAAAPRMSRLLCEFVGLL